MLFRTSGGVGRSVAFWTRCAEPCLAAIARFRIGRLVASDGFRSFACGESQSADEERTVGLVAAGRSGALGWGARRRNVLLSGDTVRKHRERFSRFEPDDWRRIQRIVDAGEWIERDGERRLLWLYEAGKPWMAILKRTRQDEIYAITYRRARGGEVRKWRALREGGE